MIYDFLKHRRPRRLRGQGQAMPFLSDIRAWLNCGQHLASTAG